MVQSSIVVPSTVSSSSTTSNNDTNISRKRSIDTSNKTDVEDTQSSVEVMKLQKLFFRNPTRSN